MNALSNAYRRAPLATCRRSPRPSLLRRGVVMAEFILVFPIFFLAIIGIVELGRAVMVQQILTNAAREGARRAVVPEATNDAVNTLVDNYLVQTSLGADTRQISILSEDGQVLDLATSNPKVVVRVRVMVPYNEVGFGIYTYFANSTMGAEVQMRKE
ncbi:MAG: TadE family protein [Aeoliella sp.]